MTGAYQFQTGCYCSTDMPAEFQKATDYILIGLKNTYCFLDDILIVSKGSEEDHKQFVLNCLKRLDEETLELTFQNVIPINWKFIGLVIMYHNQVFRQSRAKFWLF